MRDSRGGGGAGVAVVRGGSHPAVARVPVICGVTSPPLRTWQQVHEVGWKQACLVVVLESVRDGDAVELDQILRDHTDLFVIIVTARDPEGVRRLTGMPRCCIVWLDEAGDRLAALVAKACNAGAFAALAGRVEIEADLPPELRAALAFALSSADARLSIEQVAAAVGCHRSTLWRQWRAAAPPYSFRDLMERLCLVRMIQLRGGWSSWRKVAEQVGLSPRAAARKARRATGEKVGQLGTSDRSRLIAAIEQDVLSLAGIAARKRHPGQEVEQ